jgi:RND family efflux transporter MFP subunit
MNARSFFSVLPAQMAGVIVLGVTLAGCGPKSHHAKSPEPIPTALVDVQAVSAQAAEEFEEVVATVRPRLRATLEARVAGQIADLPVILGQQVKAGDLIARLNAPEIQARLDSAKAGLALAEKEWKRASTLFEQQAATRVEHEAAEARYNMALASMAEAKSMLGYMDIVAPFTGRVTRKHVDRGDLAGPGKPLVDLEDPSMLEAEAFVPEHLSGSLEAGSALTLQAKDASPALQARIRELAPAADPVSRTLLIRAELPDSAGLVSGRFIRLLVPTGKREGLRVPLSAIVHRGQLDLVFTVEENKARMHLVRLGRTVGDQVEVLSGLVAGAKVITTGASQLIDGQPLNVQ